MGINKKISYSLIFVLVFYFGSLALFLNYSSIDFKLHILEKVYTNFNSIVGII